MNYQQQLSSNHAEFTFKSATKSREYSLRKNFFLREKHYFLEEYQTKEKIVLHNALLCVENVSSTFFPKIKVLQKYCSIKVEK